MAQQSLQVSGAEAMLVWALNADQGGVTFIRPAGGGAGNAACVPPH